MKKVSVQLMQNLRNIFFILTPFKQLVKNIKFC